MEVHKTLGPDCSSLRTEIVSRMSFHWISLNMSDRCRFRIELGGWKVGAS